MSAYPYNTARWKRLRLAHLAIEPLCRGCAPHRITPANTVDHVVPMSDGGPAFPSHDGLASYCPPCHGAKTARGSEAGAIRSSKPRKGCDADGNPLDAAHPWGNLSGLTDRGPTPTLRNQLVYKRSQSGGRDGR
ncbi:HNH endonuclease signature motif containing protein [Sphingomonas sp. HMP6]|uniref:HNH endonuclease signature motif containing protein n=1 Tax=Sphingomonas sp. HMP6 TaxID=1517551 RepID=UPI0018D8F283